MSSHFILRCYALRYQDLMKGYCSGDIEACDWEGLEKHWEKHGAPNGLVHACKSEDVQCYALRYPDLLAGWCSGRLESCKWIELLEHWSTHGQREGRAFGCEGDDARCYISRYTQLLHSPLCNGDIEQCAWHQVRLHWEEIGRSEGLLFGCAEASPPPHPPPPPPPPPLPSTPPPAAQDLGGAWTCNGAAVAVVWMAATSAEAAPLLRGLDAKPCFAGTALAAHQSRDGKHLLGVSGTGRTRMATAVGWLSSRLHAATGGVAWLNVGVAGHRDLPLGTVRGLLTVYDANLETYSSFSADALDGVPTALGVTIARPAQMARVDLDALFDMEASAFFEAASMATDNKLIAAVKVVANMSDMSKLQEASWSASEPMRPVDAQANAQAKVTRLVVGKLVEAAWPTCVHVANALLGMVSQHG